MGSLGGLLGVGGGVAGTGISGPGFASLSKPVTDQQITDAYTQNQNALTQQQNLVAALQGQQGLQNQSNVYGQLQNVAAGQGPNPAQAMLQQATGQNIASQAALQAGQRGSSANVGQIARQAAQQGGNLQQQAAGQNAVMQANQSLNALGQAGNLASQMAGQQIQGTQQQTAAQQGEQSNLLNAQGQYNTVQAGQQASVNSANAGLAGTQLQGQQGVIGGLAGAAAGGLKSLFGAEGGEVSKLPMMADGGSPNGAQSGFVKFLKNTVTPPGQNPQQQQYNYGNAGANQLASGIAKFGDLFNKSQPADNSNNVSAAPQNTPGNYISNNAGMAEGGKVPAMVSPGEQYLKPRDVQKVKDGKANPMNVGEKIPGTPKVKGAKNDYANDTVSKNLDEGGIVIPRSVTQGPNPHWEAMKFVHATIAKSKHGKKNG